MRLKQNMNLYDHIRIIFLLLFIVNTYTLHLKQQRLSQSSQLTRLKQQQQLIRNQVNSLLTSQQQLKNQLQQTKTYQQKVQILQQAINNQRQSILNLKKLIIYPFNQSQTACNQINQKQKNNLIKQINQYKQKINQLQFINNKINTNLTQIQSINQQIQKQLTIIKQIQDILTIKCKKNLSPTIFQSNLNAKNWILGPQTMKDIENQYTKRAMIFHNITNCPIQAPFYNTNQQICINCTQPMPIFDMYLKQCTKCQIEQTYDQSTHTCKPMPHYTNFTKLMNWNIAGATLPTIDTKLTPCPDDRPYFNGVLCIKCQIPNYWNISSNLCQKCLKGLLFDLNTKKCQKIQPNRLTVLQNTKWISLNITKVIQQRIKILNTNQTTNNYEYCPNNTPYYDGTTCIICDYFNMDTKKCVEAPNNTQYNKNTRRFLSPQQNKQTNIINTQKYITTKPLADTSIANCNLTHPFYDNIACIQCVKPFQIFNVDNKECISCNSDQKYAQNNHRCQLRDKIYISDNFNNLLATSTVTIAAYKKSILKKINDNQQSIIVPCQINQYSNFSGCFPCQPKQYFNIEYLKCTICDGLFNQTTQTCKQKVYIFTNLKAGNLTDIQMKIQEQNKRINQFILTHNTSYICTIDKPYSIDDKLCGNCQQLFSYSTKKCTKCPEYFIYLSEQRKCTQATMIVNFTNSSRMLINNQQTLVSFRSKQQQTKNQNLKTYKICPGDKPYTQNRQFCFNCTQSSPYFNYTLKQCQNCPQNYVFDNKLVRCIQEYYITIFNKQSGQRILGYDDYSISTYKLQLQDYKKSYPYKNCTQNQPFGTISGCKNCQGSTSFFDIKKKQCSNVKYMINYPRISADYLLSNNNNLDFYVAEQQKYRKSSKQLITLCPIQKPYTNDRNVCFNCNVGQYFNLQTKICQKCGQGKSYSRQTKSCKQLFYITKFTSLSQSKMKGYVNYTLSNFKQDQNVIKLTNPYQQCAQNIPFGTIYGCMNCQQPTPYFDIKKKICSNAKKLINFTSITTNYILPEGQNITKYQNNQNNYKKYSQTLTIQCPKDSPYTQNRQSCFSCTQPNFLFNFDTKQCQSCPKGSKYINNKNKCLTIIYLTNINPQSQTKMIPTNNYTIQNFKNDQTTLKTQNTYENCSLSDPFGTIDGCRKCLPPEEYFHIQKKICTKIRKLINFNTTIPLLTKQTKTVNDYKNDQINYANTITQPTIICPINLPFTQDHDVCFTCTTPQIFNLQTKSCQECPVGEQFDKTTNKCFRRQYYTRLTNLTQKTVLINNNYTIEQYKIDQAKIRAIPLSQQCPLDKPFAASNGCIICNSISPYFNIDQEVCTSCPVDKKFIQSQNKCLNLVYVTDLTNKNIKLTNNYTLDQAKAQQNSLVPAGSVVNQCPLATPFATSIGCIACSDPKFPLFNPKSLKCQNCQQFYQYFQSNLCKDNIILTNTKKMIGYLQIDNYTRYNIQKINNITYLQNNHVVDCPADRPFYNGIQCITCGSDQPIFNLKTRICVKVDFIRKTNLSAMKYYIQTGDRTLASEKNENGALVAKNVKIQYCPQTTPYLSGSVCINCPTNSLYFNLGTVQCQTCNSGDICKQTGII